MGLAVVALSVFGLILLHFASFSPSCITLVSGYAHRNEERDLLKGTPSWLSMSERDILTTSMIAAPNVVVAKDGSGKYTTVQEAVASAPNNSHTRYIIYIKKGSYRGQVIVESNKMNLMLVGDGMHSTIITGNLNMADGTDTFHSGTVSVMTYGSFVKGEGFIAQDIGFLNTAGPAKGQAVSLRVSGDKYIFLRCKMNGYQDTLYVHQGYQFYRECLVMGTVDFIFGDASVVFQSCTIKPKLPLPGQSNMITAQGRTRGNVKTGISIQKCKIEPSRALKANISSTKTYLGRPWIQFSRTVFMESYLGAFIDPEGWHPWDGAHFGLDELYYGEYANWGPGAGTSKRVNWTGYHVVKEASEVVNFTVAKLIKGGEWMDSNVVNYTLGFFNKTH